MHALRDSGVTRISIGVQSLQPHVLGGLGRPLSPGPVERALALVDEAGFASFNVDLVFGR